MIELFAVYKYAFLLCGIAPLVLSFQGSLMVAGSRSLRILALAQAALVGNLLGRLCFSPREGHEHFMEVLFCSWMAFILLEWFFLKLASYKKLRETFFISVYLVLMAVSYLLISLFPMLESHMVAGVFGDVVSLGGRETQIMTVAFVGFAAIFGVFWKKLLRLTFEQSTLGFNTGGRVRDILFATVFATSLYSLGLLFSLAVMILPAVLLGEGARGVRRGIVLMGANALVASLAGLAASLWEEHLSTVPTQVICLLICCLITAKVVS